MQLKLGFIAYFWHKSTKFPSHLAQRDHFVTEAGTNRTNEILHTTKAPQVKLENSQDSWVHHSPGVEQYRRIELALLHRSHAQSGYSCFNDALADSFSFFLVLLGDFTSRWHCYGLPK